MLETAALTIKILILMSTIRYCFGFRHSYFEFDLSLLDIIKPGIKASIMSDTISY
jgi:hypothetical protein